MLPSLEDAKVICDLEKTDTHILGREKSEEISCVKKLSL